ncbi:MAG: Undecaprenyl-phosphate galactose phosphotransferase [Patescibacteria group bacterium]|nr:Undecaprenyl-phosphate galactose phosphotransferase [Patescibacteria group bacterium]
MRQKFQLLYNLALIFSDALAILASFSVAYILRVQIDTRPILNPISAKSYLLIYLSVLPFWLGIMASVGLYKRSFYHRFVKEFVALAVTSLIGIMALITLDFALDRPLFPARLVPVYAFGLSLGFLWLGRLVLRFIKFMAARSGKGLTRVLIIGNGDIAPKLYNNLTGNKNYEYRLEGIWMPELKANKIRDFKPSKDHLITNFSAALKRISGRHVDLIVQTEVLDDERNYQLTSAVEAAHARYKLIPSNSSLYGVKTTTDLFFGVPSLDVHITPLVGWNTVLKRIFDITLSLILLIVAVIPMIILAILVKLSDFRGPVFYKHARVTRFGQTFYIYKFRSMYWKYCTGGKKTNQQVFREMGREDLLHEWETTQKLKNDPRITPLGKFLRKTSLDELPQLINVLQGKLSLIGPRAITKEELIRYKASRDKFLSVKPGITGLWQVSGRNNLGYEDRVKLDVYYVQNWSLWLDIKILFKTIGVVLTRSGE